MRFSEVMGLTRYTGTNMRSIHLGMVFVAYAHLSPLIALARLLHTYLGSRSHNLFTTSRNMYLPTPVHLL